MKLIIKLPDGREFESEGYPIADPAVEFFQKQAELLAEWARANGVVVTIEQVPLQPLAMRNHADKVTARKAR